MLSISTLKIYLGIKEWDLAICNNLDEQTWVAITLKERSPA